jgi:hypothetical protein
MMCLAAAEDKLTKILVIRDYDTLLGGGSSENVSVICLGIASATTKTS